MADDILTQPPVDTAAPGGAGTGVASPQPEPEPVVAEPGAEQEAPKPERTYTQKEWAARESAKDKEIAQHRVNQVRTQQYYEGILAQTAEGQAQAADRGAVERGEITEADAHQRAQQRQQAQQQARTEQQRLAGIQQAEERVDAKLRVEAALQLAKEHGVEAKALLHESIQDFPTMREKAMELKLEQLSAALKTSQAGPGETYDSGKVGRTGKNVDTMSAEEKIAFGYSQPTRKRS